MATPSLAEKAAAFAALHESGCFVLPNAWDMPSAALIAEAGFPALATTSAGVAFAQGLPDGESIGRSRMIETAGAIARRMTLPVSADLEAGYGPTPDDVAETIRAALGAGLVGANIEDVDPRTGKLFPFDQAVARIRAACDAANASGVRFVVNARSDPYLVGFGTPAQCFDEAVRRVNAFLAVGARCSFVPGPADAETIGRLAAAVKGPLNVLGGFRGAAAPPLETLRRLGVRRVSLGGSLMLASYTATRRALEGIRDAGVFDYANGAISNGHMSTLLAKYDS
jgi:2-methylisocitrate lyase-like PEP mutase family enzyme